MTVAITRTPEEKRAHTEALIALMLKKAETTTPEEAELLMAQAEKLMLKFDIQNITAESADKKAEKIITARMDFEGIFAKAYVLMGFSIANGLGSLKCVQSHYKNTHRILHIVGYESDVERAKTLIQSLQVQAVMALGKFTKNIPSWYTGSDKFNARRSFIIGFGDEAGIRIANTRRTVIEEEETSTPGTEIVLVNRAARVEDAFDELFSDLRQGRAIKVTVGYRDGRNAGASANIGQKGMAGARKGITQ
jgi:hypothetical protein